MNNQQTRSCCTAQGTLISVMWQPGWEWSSGENGYVYMYGWVPLLSSWSYHDIVSRLSVQFSSVAQSCPTLCNPMNRSTPGLPAHHQLSESTQTQVHRVGDAIQPSHPLSSPSPPAPPPILQYKNTTAKQTSGASLTEHWLEAGVRKARAQPGRKGKDAVTRGSGHEEEADFVGSGQSWGLRAPSHSLKTPALGSTPGKMSPLGWVKGHGTQQRAVGSLDSAREERAQPRLLPSTGQRGQSETTHRKSLAGLPRCPGTGTPQPEPGTCSVEEWELLPGPERGPLSTRRWLVRGDPCADKAWAITWKRHRAESRG